MLRWSERKASHFDSTESHWICWGKWLSKWSGIFDVMSVFFDHTPALAKEKYEQIVSHTIWKLCQTDAIKMFRESANNKIITFYYLLSVVIDDVNWVFEPWRWWEALWRFYCTIVLCAGIKSISTRSSSIVMKFDACETNFFFDNTLICHWFQSIVPLPHSV